MRWTRNLDSLMSLQRHFKRHATPKQMQYVYGVPHFLHQTFSIVFRICRGFPMVLRNGSERPNFPIYCCTILATGLTSREVDPGS